MARIEKKEYKDILYFVVRADKRCGEDIESAIKNILNKYKDYNYVVGGGAYPEAFVYPQKDYIDIKYLSAREASRDNISYSMWYEIDRISHSVHSCWKLKKHQAIVLMVRFREV